MQQHSSASTEGTSRSEEKVPSFLAKVLLALERKQWSQYGILKSSKLHFNSQNPFLAAPSLSL